MGVQPLNPDQPEQRRRAGTTAGAGVRAQDAEPSPRPSPSGEPPAEPKVGASRRGAEDGGEVEHEPGQFDLRALGKLDIRSTMVTGLFVLAVLYTLYVARAVLMPIAVATLLAILLAPVVNWVSRLTRVPAWVSTMLIMLAAIVAVVAGAYSMSGPASRWAQSLPDDLREAQWKLREVLAPVEELREASREVERMAAEDDGDAADDDESVPVRLEGPPLVETVLSSAPRTLVAIGLTVALLYFLLASGDLFVYKLVRVAPTLADKKRALEIVHDIKSEISHYILTITLINIGLGVAVGLTLWLLGMPNAALWGAMATVFNFVPYLGAVVGLVLVSLVALVSFDTAAYALLIGGSYVTLTTIEGNFVTPSILGRRLPLNAVVIFVGLIFWAWIWGIPGAFLAVPILAAVKIICDHVEQLAPIGEFLGR